MSFVLKMFEPHEVPKEARQAALNRVHQDPGIPDPKNSSQPFWLKNPHPVVAKAQSTTLPMEADIVIIGSGITGVSTAYSLFEHSEPNALPSVVMLEARDASSGATGRNGGHILQTCEEYRDLKIVVGKEAAMKLIGFKLAHRDALVELADKLRLTESTQIRKVQFLSVYFEEDTFRDACVAIAELKQDLPLLGKDFVSYAGQEAREKFLLPQAIGVICGPGGAIWPYRLTTSVLAKLRTDFPDDFRLETNTPVTEIIEDSQSRPSHPFRLVTPRGFIRAKHIVHASNGHVGHLVPGLIGRTFPIRGQMSAQRPGENFPFQGYKHSWILNYERGFDYLTQLPHDEPMSNGEMMLGGGLAQASKQGLEEIGIATDFGTNVYADIHLSGVLSAVFGRANWGKVNGRSVTSMWTGTMGFSSDGFPWVGKLLPSLTNRKHVDDAGISSAEWVAAAFSGEGMVHCWLSGKALAVMILDHDGKLQSGVSRDISIWFPEQFLVTEERVSKTLLPRHITK